MEEVTARDNDPPRETQDEYRATRKANAAAKRGKEGR